MTTSQLQRVSTKLPLTCQQGVGDPKYSGILVVQNILIRQKFQFLILSPSIILFIVNLTIFCRKFFQSIGHVM